MYKLIASSGESAYGVNEYAVDTPEDIQNLPTQGAMGSIVIVISTGEVYMKNSEGKWVKI